MFSSRLHWQLRPNRLTELLREKRQAGTVILDLTESNPTHAGFSYPSQEILQSFGDSRSLVYDPAPAGSIEARTAVSGYYGARGQSVDPEQILLTASTSESYAYLFKLLTEAGDRILVPRPSYPLFEFLAAMESVYVEQYPLVYNGRWSPDLDFVARAVNGRTRAIVVVNPNNPTGSFLKRDELDSLVALCVRDGLAIISDEVFADYAFVPDPTRIETLAGVNDVLTFCLSGLSKVAGLPQMKLGWIVTGGPAAVRPEAKERLELIADTYLSVGTPVQHALPRLLAVGAALQQQISERTRKNLDFLRSSLASESACRVLDLEGGWYAILQISRTCSEEEWVLGLLDREHVLVQPGFFYDFESEAFLVLSLLTWPETFQEGVSRIVSRVNARWR